MMWWLLGCGVGVISGTGGLARNFSSVIGAGGTAGDLSGVSWNARGLEVPLLQRRQPPAGVGAHRRRVPADRLDLDVDGLVVAVEDLHPVPVRVAQVGEQHAARPVPARAALDTVAVAVDPGEVAGGEDVPALGHGVGEVVQLGPVAGRRSPGPGRCPCGT